MAEHYAEPIGVEQIAAEMGTSPSSLTRIFRRCAGRTPAAELRRIRIRKVKTFLRTTDFTLEHIADLTGFSHASHLLHVFREQEGISPTEWRRNWK